MHINKESLTYFVSVAQRLTTLCRERLQTCTLAENHCADCSSYSAPGYDPAAAVCLSSLLSTPLHEVCRENQSGDSSVSFLLYGEHKVCPICLPAQTNKIRWLVCRLDDAVGEGRAGNTTAYMEFIKKLNLANVTIRQK